MKKWPSAQFVCLFCPFIAAVRVGEAEGDPERDGRRTLANGWESRLWKLEDKHLREGSSVRQFGKPRPLRIRHRRRSI